MTGRVIGIGWDVGGWMGSNHGLAVCEWIASENSVFWHGSQVGTSLPTDRLMGIGDILAATDSGLSLTETDRVTLGIDAPLGYPVAFQKLLHEEAHEAVTRPEREIDNPYAYRLTDRLIHRRFMKKPLSASFDRIGNNATVALSHAAEWREEGFKRMPHEETAYGNSLRQLIEVYPALVKTGRFKEATEPFRSVMPPLLEVGTDVYDAAICALYALAFSIPEPSRLLKLERPSERDMTLARTEGWIYHPFVDRNTM
ncbi:DUF429 domain-containing protein [Salisediminibacterium selenitireducens]|uniref:DUF429 domain-containing protein n=1 Tax=Bacillus selenitireducens (strain ATCC 700615 / DSM 15326 / MLS10) TaxID=439292 RepID=D6XSL7_BACIE|nr:DUF429 domain-containing protein [Salisediminibacterium selenitireducens]ADH98803.1 conserved hypothetical protein [[Bacillus] selenitireducens MLS10]